MNYSHDNWSAILAHIGKPEELDTSARNAGALTRRREIRDAATLLRLGLAYGPGGMSLREVTAWAQLHDVATLSDVALLKRLRNAADWFGILAAQTLAVRAAVTGCTSGKRLRLVDGTAISAPGCKMASESIMVWHLNRSRFGIRIDHDLASISDHSLASQSITIWHASDH